MAIGSRFGSDIVRTATKFTVRTVGAASHEGTSGKCDIVWATAEFTVRANCNKKIEYGLWFMDMEENDDGKF